MYPSPTLAAAVTAEAAKARATDSFMAGLTRRGKL